MNLICGINPVLEALSAGTRQFDRLVVAKGLRNRRVADAIARATQLGVPLRFEGRPALDHMANGMNHQGIIAVVSAKAVLDFDGLMSQARDPALLVVLDGVEDPRNLGAIVRTVEGAGADGIVVPERHTAPLSETVSRSSSGALEYVRVARVGNLVQAIEAIKARGLWVVGFDASATERWHAPDYRRPVALVFGGEGRGMRRLVREHCDQVAALPLFGQVTSLNVSVTVGAVLYEVVRQRGFVPSHVRPIPVRSAAKPREIVGPDADDSEEDPGRIGPPAGLELTPAEPASEQEAVELPHAISVIDLHEEVAWDSRGTASVTGQRLRTWRQHEGPRGRREQSRGAAGGEEQPRRAGENDARPDSRGPRRRRRRGRGRPPSGRGPMPPQQRSEPGPDSAPPSAGQEPSDGGETQGSEQARRGRRRHRRRRH